VFEEAFEPIAVIPEALEAPPPAAPGFEAARGPEPTAGAAAPGPRPEGSALRMPYADEQPSEFAWLLQRAGELRGLGESAVAAPASEESEPGFDPPSDGPPPRHPMRCPYVRPD
jgi:hypothetical protein